ncbi:MAG: sigma-54-dependent transcriptional regulator [Bdellovibrionia bacterium]
MEMVHFIPPSQRRLALLASQADLSPVLIYGASGTGKGAIAKWIHANSPRTGRALITAQNDQPLFDQLIQAQGGTFVIPEIGKWPLSDQKKLLTFLESKCMVHPTDEQLTTVANVRIIATTSQALEGRAQGGLFNPELLDQFSQFRIEMPSLNQRKDEFMDIAMGILGEVTRELHREYLRNFSDEAWSRLQSYEWPGNLRELRNVISLAAAAAPGDQIETQDLPHFEISRIDFRSTREEFEKIYILELLRTSNGDIDHTCKMNQINRASLDEKIRLYGISLQQDR